MWPGGVAEQTQRHVLSIFLISILSEQLWAPPTEPSVELCKFLGYLRNHIMLFQSK
jgi:hypothetical protein